MEVQTVSTRQAISESIPTTRNPFPTTGLTYEVSNAEVGTTLDFRIGKREADAELDAFVFHLNANLTDAELNALFA
jgi:hypothetical protein